MKSNRFFNRTLLLGSAILVGSSVLNTSVWAQEDADEGDDPVFAGFQDSFRGIERGLSPRGRNDMFMPLIPGFRLLLKGEDDGEFETLLITVLPGCKLVGGQVCAIVQEKEWAGCDLVEISWNYMAISKRHGGIYYFGEDVDIYEEDGTIVHDGAWLAGEDGNRAGLLMPGYPLVGSRYYQEFAPDMALDRAEHLSVSEVVTTPAGTFSNCLFVEESSPLEPDHFSYKWYAPGIGLVKDGHLELVDHGFRVEVPDLCEEEEGGNED